MKKPLLIKSLLLLCALTVGNVAWATEELYYTLDGTVTTGGNSNYAEDGNGLTQNNISWSVTGNTTLNPWRIGGKNLSNVDREAYTKTAMGSAITKVELEIGSITLTSLNSIKFIVASNSDFNKDVEEYTISPVSPATSIAANQTITFVPTSPATEWGSGLYYKFVFNVTAGGSNSYVQMKSAKFYHEASGGGSSVDAPSFSPVAGAINAGTTVTLTQAAADQIRYTTDGTDPTKTTGTVYSTPIEITTATTIKAIAIKGDDVSSVATAVYTINVASPTFNLEGGSSYMQGTNITITSAGNTIYYNLTTDGSTPGNPTNASTEYTAPIVLGSGTTKIKAIAYDTYGNASSVITRTYTGMALASLPFSWTGTSSAGKDELNAETGVALSLGSNYAESNAPYRLKFDGVGKNVTIYTDAKPENVYFTAKLFNAASTGSKMKVQGSDDGIEFTDIEEFTIKGAANATFEFTTSNAFAATHRAVKLVMSSKDQNVAVGSIIISSAIPVTITDADYATFVSDKKTDFAGTGITAYTAKVNGNSVTLTSIEKVPANTPVVVYKDVAATTTFAVPVTTADIAEVSENDLWVSDGTTATSANNVYVLGNNTEGIGFYKWTGASSLSAGKVYLNVPAESRDYLTFAFEDQATGVGASLMNSEKCKVNSDIFDLQGRRVVNPTKGLYIVNGKKVIVK